MQNSMEKHANSANNKMSKQYQSNTIENMDKTGQSYKSTYKTTKAEHVTHHLYHNAEILKKKKQDAIKSRNEEVTQMLAESRKYCKTITHSQRMYDARLKQRLGEIFEMLDANGNGRISAEEINLDIIPPEVLVVLKPLLVEMENFDEELDREEFVDSSIALFEKLDIGQRNTILNYNKTENSANKSFFEQDLVFHPKISKISH